jgi:hypothetical protein
MIQPMIPACIHSLRRAKAELLMSFKIPRIIYSLWLQGVTNAPNLVQLNLSRWAELNPTYRMEVLDLNTVKDLLAHVPIDIDRLTPQALSDVVRTRLLLATGGHWVDASVYPAQSLDTWLPDLITTSGFFAFARPGPDRPISSWFLAASEDNRMMRAWWEMIEIYWSVPRSYRPGIPANPVEAIKACSDSFPYFWFHYLFQRLLDENREFALAWSHCIKISADAPHVMQARLGEVSDPNAEEIMKLVSGAPIHKLNWRAKYPLEALAAS